MKQKLPILKSPLWKLSARMFAVRMSAVVLSFLVFFLAAELLKVQDWACLICAGVAGGIFFLCMEYRLAEHAGGKDYNYVKYKHLTQDLAKGLKAGLMAETPVLMLLLSALFLQGDNRESLKFFLFFANMHVGWLHKLVPSVWIFLIPVALTSALGWIGYRNGYKQIDIWGKLIYRVPQANKRR